jgi:LmbE family N-acetylglucosaminyl deacetylase
MREFKVYFVPVNKKFKIKFKKNMKILYIFPHPDDESFGPAAGISAQIKAGHEVYLLTLTKGGATKKRFDLGLSVEEMGEVRYKEMLEVEKTLGLSGMTVLDLPDSGLKEMDPREIEAVIKEHIQKIKPAIIISYPVHGISGFHDHLVMHAAAKNVYLDMKDEGHTYLKRLAFYTISKEDADRINLKSPIKIQASPEELIDCVTPVSEDDKEQMRKALMCYETYKDTIESTGVMNALDKAVFFEIYMEKFSPPLKDISEGL